jgi:hypothetical protein
MGKSSESRLTEEFWRYRKLEGEARIKREKAQNQLMLVVLASWLLPLLVSTFMPDYVAAIDSSTGNSVTWRVLINTFLYIGAFYIIFALLVATIREAARSEGEANRAAWDEVAKTGIDPDDLRDEI